VKRRRLLRLGGLTLTTTLGGCASRGGIEEESEFTLTRTGEIPVEKRTSDFVRSYPGQEPFAEVVFGEKPKSSDNFYGVEIYNDFDSSVAVTLTVDRGVDERTLVFEGEGTVSNDAYFAIAISRPDTYVSRLEVSGEDVDLQQIFDVPQSAWDAEPRDDKGLSPEHNVHIQRNKIEVRFVGEER
jgi:hypothetical protein